VNPRSVFLDANVLMPVSLSDVLMRLAETGALKIYWSQHALDAA